MGNRARLSTNDGEIRDEGLFESMAFNLERKGYSIHPGALSPCLSEALLAHLGQMPERKFDPAGIGRDEQHMLNNFVRTDEICWITGESEAGRQWLDWTGALQKFLNQRLFLGLFSFESHFAHYAPGAYYKRHLDAFKGEANRVLSLVVYLNPSWIPEYGGELVLYTGKDSEENIRVLPLFGTVVSFLSEDFPHEVLPASQDRYSVAGWFRVNTSVRDRTDPPL